MLIWMVLMVLLDLLVPQALLATLVQRVQLEPWVLQEPQEQRV